MKSALSCLLFLVLSFNTSVAGVIVSTEKFQNLAFDNLEVSVKAGSFVGYPFDIPTSGNITVNARVLNATFDDGSIWVCSSKGFQLMQQKQKNKCRGINRGRGNIEFSVQAPRPGRYFLVADNRFSLLETKHYRISVNAPNIIDIKLRQALTQLLTEFSEFIPENYIVPDFDISVVPCGTVNAFSQTSNGNITLCSEFVFEALKNRSTGALIGILFHETGHSLLNLWGLPNYANEETVDEFATYLLLKTGSPTLLQEYVEYFKLRDSSAEADYIISVGGTHPLSVQRARNVLNNARNPVPFSNRWNRLLYPHMTDTSLMKIVRNPDELDALAIAKTELRRRGVSF
ncbi:MAG: hypothetical protein COA53_04560 [Rhodobacteraceae bacterium]|nr:MAG: hypothetical protein COA53_04560 [Paracoccaceae bacterium]